ncbi:DNA damage-regulated autophagy modulator protein 2-like isoform X2 [Crassostrea virginica]
MMCLRGFCEGLSYLPLIMIVLTLETFILSYIFAVSRGDVNPYFPYISDTGTKVPESCVFGQFLNMAAVVALCTLYVRYKLVQSIVQSEEESVLKLNKVAFIFGILSPLGLSLVANFQETSVEKVHVTGATLVLGCGVVYEFLQTAISFKMHPTYNGLRICKIRLVISVISLIGFITRFQNERDIHLHHCFGNYRCPACLSVVGLH